MALFKSRKQRLRAALMKQESLKKQIALEAKKAKEYVKLEKQQKIIQKQKETLKRLKGIGRKPYLTKEQAAKIRKGFIKGLDVIDGFAAGIERFGKGTGIIENKKKRKRR